MTNNLFELAIAADEVNAFFRGEGKYFVPSPNYEGHVHGAHMGGFARTYAEKSDVHSDRFDQAFLVFMQSLDINKKDLNHLLANLSAYFSQKSRGGFLTSVIFSDMSSAGSRLLGSYIAEIYKSPFSREVQDQIMRHAKFISSKGNSVLSEIVENLMADK